MNEHKRHLNVTRGCVYVAVGLFPECHMVEEGASTVGSAVMEVREAFCFAVLKILIGFQISRPGLFIYTSLFLPPSPYPFLPLSADAQRLIRSLTARQAERGEPAGPHTPGGGGAAGQR